MQKDVKEQLIQAAVTLLRESKTPDKITARQIAAQANTNLAMINYYFNSKNELINLAVGRIIEERASTLNEIMAKTIPAKQKLTEFLITMSDIMTEYSEITRPSVPYLLLEGNMDLPYTILPLVRECSEGKKSETECRILAYQIISFFQLIFYRSESFKQYTGIDIKSDEQRNKSINMIVDLFHL